MKILIIIVIIGAAVFSAYAIFYEDKVEDARWLHGQWELYDPTGESKKDYMEFFPNGTVDLNNKRKTYATCKYASKIGHLLLTCMVKGSEKEIAFEVSPDNKIITNSAGTPYKKQK